MRSKILSNEAAINKCKELAALVNLHTDSKGNGAHATAINPLVFTRECDPPAAIQGGQRTAARHCGAGRKRSVAEGRRLSLRCRSVFGCVGGYAAEWMCGRGNPQSALSRI